MKAVIGIDIGSSAIKAVLFDLDEMSVLHTSRIALDSRIFPTPPGHFEEDPDIIRIQAFNVIRSLAQFASEKAITIEDIAFTGQMHGGLLVDSRLEPLTNFITWQDKRGDEINVNESSYVNELRAFASPDLTGVGVHTGFLISTCSWLQRHHAISPRAACVLGIYDWLTSLLAGRPVTDISSAAAWGMYDPIALSWRTDILDRANIPLRLLPEVAEPGENLGRIDHTLADKIGLPHGIRMHASIGDTQAAYLGSECAKNEILLNFGTGSQSMWETSRLEATQGTDIRYLGKHKYLACASTLAGGEAYLVVANFFRETVKIFTGQEISMAETLTIMNRLAFESDSGGITIDPIFSGSKFRQDSERGSIAGLSSENFHPGSLMRSLVEGMIEEVAKPYFIRRDNGTPTGIVGAGNALVRNAALKAAAEARFGLLLRLGRFEESAAVGAALLCRSNN
jgi:sedoheptulokinase